MKKVYKYKVFNINSGEMQFVDSYATLEYINKIEGSKVMYETVMEVDANDLNGDGKLICKE